MMQQNCWTPALILSSLSGKMIFKLERVEYTWIGDIKAQDTGDNRASVPVSWAQQGPADAPGEPFFSFHFVNQRRAAPQMTADDFSECVPVLEG